MKDITVNDIIKEHTPSIKKLVNQLRKSILNAVPEIYEKALPGWHAIGFRHPECGHFCAVFSFKDSVKLYFEYGAYLKDPDGILEGNAEQVRYITFRKITNIQKIVLKKLVQQAVLDLTNRK
jgi:hypothetical protein